MKQKVADIAFIVIVLVVLLAGLFKTVFMPKEVNYYENRPANKLTEFSVPDFKDGVFQDNVENALSDQIPLSQAMKKVYNEANSYLHKFAKDLFKGAQKNKYTDFGLIKQFDGEYFCNRPLVLSEYQNHADSAIANINAVIGAHPDVEFYGYYVEKDIDVDFETGERFGLYEYVKQRTNFKAFENFKVDGFDTYKKYFYKTDHHWNKDGSYKAYTELLTLLDINEKPLGIQGSKLLTDRFSGANAKGKGISGYYEDLEVNLFDYTPGAVYYHGQQQKDYGFSETDFSYGGWYGADLGELVFTNDKPDGENLLVIGDSYDNAVVRLLSSHCKKLCSIDLRYNKDFELSSYIQEHQIDKVLVIGSNSVFWAEDFYMEDKNI